MGSKIVVRGLVVAILAGIALVVVGFWPSTSSGKGGQVQQQRTVESSPAAPVSPPSATSTIAIPSSTAPSIPSAQSVVPVPSQGTPISTPSTVESAPDSMQPVPAPAGADSFSVVLKTQLVGDLPAVVNGANVESHAVIEPPEPEGEDWSETSIWVRASAYPSSPSTGTSYVSGHSCRSHICPFSDVQRKPDGTYTVLVGDQMIVTTPSGVLTYLVCGVGSSPKYLDDGVTHNPNLLVPDCGGIRPDIVVITCQFEEGSSNNNIVIATRLTSSTAA